MKAFFMWIAFPTEGYSVTLGTSHFETFKVTLILEKPCGGPMIGVLLEAFCCSITRTVQLNFKRCLVEVRRL